MIFDCRSSKSGIHSLSLEYVDVLLIIEFVNKIQQAIPVLKFDLNHFLFYDSLLTKKIKGCFMDPVGSRKMFAGMWVTQVGISGYCMLKKTIHPSSNIPAEWIVNPLITSVIMGVAFVALDRIHRLFDPQNYSKRSMLHIVKPITAAMIGMIVMKLIQNPISINFNLPENPNKQIILALVLLYVTVGVLFLQRKRRLRNQPV